MNFYQLKQQLKHDFNAFIQIDNQHSNQNQLIAKAKFKPLGYSLTDAVFEININSNQEVVINEQGYLNFLVLNTHISSHNNIYRIDKHTKKKLLQPVLKKHHCYINHLATVCIKGTVDEFNSLMSHMIECVLQIACYIKYAQVEKILN